MTDLVRYDAACKALAVAKTTDDVKTIRNQAEAMRAYAKQAKNKQLEIDAAEIRIRAERRLGDLIAAQKASVGLQAGARGRKGAGTRGSKKEPQLNAPSSLADAGIDKKLSMQAQQLAALDQKDFEAQLTDWRTRQERENGRVTASILRGADRSAVPRLRPFKVNEAVERIGVFIRREYAKWPAALRPQFRHSLAQLLKELTDEQ